MAATVSTSMIPNPHGSLVAKRVSFIYHLISKYTQTIFKHFASSNLFKGSTVTDCSSSFNNVPKSVKYLMIVDNWFDTSDHLSSRASKVIVVLVSFDDEYLVPSLLR